MIIITKGKESVCQFSGKHKSIFILVVQFQALQEIFITALIFVFLDLAEDGEEFIDLLIKKNNIKINNNIERDYGKKIWKKLSLKNPVIIDK